MTSFAESHRLRWHLRAVALVVAGICLACGDSPVGPALTPGIRTIMARTPGDTIGAVLDDSLHVQVADSAGRPAAGQIVRFEVLPMDVDPLRWYTPWYPLRLDDAPVPSRTPYFAVDTTDNSGRAAVQVSLDRAAGQAAVLVRAPALGYADTAYIRVNPGAADGFVISPADSVAYVGRGYTLQAYTVDRAGNARTDGAPNFSVIAGPVSVAASGAMTGSSIGRATIMAQLGRFSTTAAVSVAPTGWVAAMQHSTWPGNPPGIKLVQLDGSGTKQLSGPIDAFGLGWSPDGSEVAAAYGKVLDLISTDGTTRRLLTMENDMFLGARFSFDGQWIYFANSGGSGQATGLYRVRRDGSGLEHIDTFGTSSYDFRPSPSPDGSAVVYGSSTCTPLCLRVVDLTSHTVRQYGTQDFLVRGATAAWSPKGDLIAYTDAEGIVGLIAPDGTGQRVLGTDVYAQWLDWSPDGRWLLASSEYGPPTLFDSQSGMRLPLISLRGFSAAAWKP
jgi:hypothetical protein